MRVKMTHTYKLYNDCIKYDFLNKFAQEFTPEHGQMLWHLVDLKSAGDITSATTPADIVNLLKGKGIDVESPAASKILVDLMKTGRLGAILGEPSGLPKGMPAPVAPPKITPKVLDFKSQKLANSRLNNIIEDMPRANSIKEFFNNVRSEFNEQLTNEGFEPGDIRKLWNEAIKQYYTVSESGRLRPTLEYREIMRDKGFTPSERGAHAASIETEYRDLSGGIFDRVSVNISRVANKYPNLTKAAAAGLLVFTGVALFKYFMSGKKPSTKSKLKQDALEEAISSSTPPRFNGPQFIEKLSDLNNKLTSFKSGKNSRQIAYLDSIINMNQKTISEMSKFDDELTDDTSSVSKHAASIRSLESQLKLAQPRLAKLATKFKKNVDMGKEVAEVAAAHKEYITLISQIKSQSQG